MDLGHDSLFPSFGHGNERSTIWKTIIKPLHGTGEYSHFIANGIGVSIGNGGRVNFLVEEWIKGYILKFVFPKVFSLVIKKRGNLKILENGSAMNDHGKLS